ncbi:MAG: DUF3775 domain-containing protein [Hyphomicrobiaceae bacterium]
MPTRRSTQSSVPSDEVPSLEIALDKVCWIILKAREFDVKDVSSDMGPAADEGEEGMYSVLEDRGDDPVEHELRSFIADLSDDEQIDLVALSWLGREDNTLADWQNLRAEAARAHQNRRRQTATYLLGEPLLGDFLEEAVNMLGHNCQDHDVS